MLAAIRVLLLVGVVASPAFCFQSGQTPLTNQGVQRDSVEWTDPLVTRAMIWSPIKPGDKVLPTLIFSPGFGTTPSQYSTLLSQWARAGYFVVGIAHPQFTNPDEVELYDASNVIPRQLMRAIDHILQDRQRSGSPFSRVDPKRIGLVGHSVGGSAAAQASAWDPRVRAAMDLDGTIFGDVVHSGMRQPFFLIRKRVVIDPKDPPQFFEHRDQGNLHEDSVFANSTTMYWLTVDHLDHMAFTDTALESAADNSGSTSAARIQEITTTYVLDFFGHYLSGTPPSVHLHQAQFPGTDLRVQRPDEYVVSQCPESRATERLIGGRLKLLVPRRAVLVKGKDIDYSSYRIGLKGAKTEWLAGIYGPSATSGTVSDKWLTDSVESKQRVWRAGQYEGVDAKGKLKNGKFWRYFGHLGEAIEYYDVSAAAASYFDSIIDSACFSEWHRR